jgi:hypothetical protein
MMRRVFSFTRERSKVRSLVRPPLTPYAQWFIELIPWGVPQKSWGTIGALQFGSVEEHRSAMAYPRRRNSEANQEAWLIHHDDIRVGSNKGQWGWRVRFFSTSHRGCQPDTFDQKPQRNGMRACVAGFSFGKNSRIRTS